jgi:hypothetical protein
MTEADEVQLEDRSLTMAMQMARRLFERPVSGDDSLYAVGEGVMALEAIFEGARETLSLGVSAEDLGRFRLLLHGSRRDPPLTAADFRWAHDFVLRSLKLWQDRGQKPHLTAEGLDAVARIYESVGLFQRRPSKRERERARLADSEGG